LPHQTLQKFDQKRSASNFLLKESFIKEKRFRKRKGSLGFLSIIEMERL